MSKRKCITLMVLASMLVSACTANNTVVPSHASKVLERVNSAPELWVRDEETNPKSSQVLIVLQGGPKEYLYFVKDGRTLSRYLPGYKDRNVVYLHQAQTLNPSIFGIGKNFTIEHARVESEATTEMLNIAIGHFKDAGKSVTVVGHSYGAFTVIDYLTNYDSKADNYIISAGRIAVPKDMVADNMRGYSSQFAEDGTTYIPVSEVDLSDRSSYEQGAYHVRALLKAAYGEPAYGEGLSNRDLRNVFFITGKSDQQVGTLTPTESALLEGQGAKVIHVEGGHYEVYKRMIDKVMEGKISF